MTSVTNWISANVRIAASYREVAMDYALALGGLAIVEYDDYFQVSCPADSTSEQTLNKLKAFIRNLDPAAGLTQEWVGRENWNRNWETYFKPTEINSHLIVLPEQEEPYTFPHELKIRILPTMAFGTGTHETTRLCLQLSEKNIHKQDHVLDIGTGNGILGIAALKLEVAIVDALENNPLS